MFGLKLIFITFVDIGNFLTCLYKSKKTTFRIGAGVGKVDVISSAFANELALTAKSEKEIISQFADSKIVGKKASLQISFSKIEAMVNSKQNMQI